MPIVLALVGALSAWPDLLAVTGLYLRLLLVGLALHVALDALEERHARGLLWLVLVWCAAPGAVGLLGLGLGATLFGHLAQRATRTVLSRPALGLVAGFILAACAVSLTLPLPTPLAWNSAPTVASSPAQEDTGVARETRPFRSPPAVSRSIQGESTPPLIARSAEGLISLLLGLLAVTFALVGYRMWQVRSREQGDWHWSDVLPILALLSGAVMLMLYALLRTSAGTGGPLSGRSAGLPATGEEGAAGAQGVTWLFTTLSWVGWFGLIGMCLLLMGVIFALWRLRVESGQDRPPSPAEEESRVNDPETALHRVRLAYRAMLSALEDAGALRGPHETPREFAERVAALFPGQRGNIEDLTRLYQPVRYGREVTDEHADEAEEALSRLLAGLTTTAPSIHSQELS
ncbi:hypothetical protein Deipe_0221 [Deinococcus peraridilitoris DSM 19664]|uniref:Protein-glutamine gamma-glutamyltransferase-like C-terminal domain-containing protein n=2 Tax=Deinococcus TaxID=1298 RepID=K9ZXA0_DEIPD|nr:hypothetical protein Deipe_0221 [Deinococcus peraridilitoris DSM 19664]